MVIPAIKKIIYNTLWGSTYINLSGEVVALRETTKTMISHRKTKHEFNILLNI